MDKIGFIGLGAMGGKMVRHLLKADYEAATSAIAGGNGAKDMTHVALELEALAGARIARAA